MPATGELRGTAVVVVACARRLVVSLVGADSVSPAAPAAAAAAAAGLRACHRRFVRGRQSRCTPTRRS
jgi:hypothetical protein